MDFKHKALTYFLENKMVSKSEANAVNEYRDKHIFSLNKELLSLLYLAITFFTTGIGILIFQNINTIGHTILVVLLFIMIFCCYIYCFKNAPKFQKHESLSKNLFVDYILLLGMILTCTFIGYIQYQYNIFGNNYNIATFIPALIGLICAYFFDHKGVLSIALTGFVSCVGLTVNPKSLLGVENINAYTMSCTGILTGLLFILWSYYCKNIGLKKHFTLIFHHFALHLMGICCLLNLVDKYWFLYAPLFAVIIFYFFLFNKKQKSITLFVFSFLYAFIGLNLIQFKILDFLNEAFFFYYLIFMMVSILGFIRLLQNFKNQTNDSF